MTTNKEIQLIDDITLLEKLCSSEDDQLVFEEFVKRFLPAVLAECKEICKKRKLDSHIGIEIGHQAFERVRKYKSFSREKRRIEHDRKWVLGYLFTICRRLFLDHHNKSKEENHNESPTYFDKLSTFAESTIDVDQLVQTKEIATKIFSKLNSKEQTVILADLEWKRDGGLKYLPDFVTNSLAEQLQVKPDSIRKSA